MNDNVSHPTHYTQGPIHPVCGEVVECITVTEHHNFNVGNAIKYLWRADHKDNALEDLAKAAQYIQFEIDRRKYEAARNEPPLFDEPGPYVGKAEAREDDAGLDVKVTVSDDAPAWFSALVKSLQDTLPGVVITSGGWGPKAASKGTHDGGMFDIPKRGAFGEPILNVADIDREAAFDFIRCLTGTCDHDKADYPGRAGN